MEEIEKKKVQNAPRQRHNSTGHSNIKKDTKKKYNHRRYKLSHCEQ